MFTQYQTFAITKLARLHWYLKGLKATKANKADLYLTLNEFKDDNQYDLAYIELSEVINGVIQSIHNKHMLKDINVNLETLQYTVKRSLNTTARHLGGLNTDIGCEFISLVESYKFK